MLDACIRPVHAAYELDDTFFDAKRPVGDCHRRRDFVDNDQAIASQCAVRTELLAGLTSVVMLSEQQADREVASGIAAAQIVLHIGIEPLKRSIELGRKREQQNIALELVEAENVADNIKRCRRAGIVHGPAALCDRVAGEQQRPRDLGTCFACIEPRLRGAFGAGQQSVGLGVGDAPTQPVRRRNAVPVPAQPCGPPLQQQAQPPQLGGHQGAIGLQPRAGVRDRRGLFEGRAHGTA